MKKLIYILTALFILSSCYDRDIEVKSPSVNKLSGLEYTLDYDTLRVSWKLPDHAAPLKVRIAHNAGVTILDNNPTVFNYGIIKVGQEYKFTFKVMDENENLSTGETIAFKREGGLSVRNVRAFLPDAPGSVKIVWQLPEEELSKVVIRYAEQEIELPGTATEYTIENLPVNLYTFGVVSFNKEGLSSETVYVDAKTGVTRVAFLGVADSPEAITDDDEKAAANWFFKAYPEGKYISFAEIAAGVDLSLYKVLWWIYDSETGSNLPEEALEPDVLNAIRTYYQNGGNLLLNTHAVPYLWELGRMKARYPNRVIGAGPGGDNPDTWSMNVGIGIHDETSHPVHIDVPYIEDENNKLIMLIGPGWKEDHNYVFTELGGYYEKGNGDEALYAAISDDDHIRILATWSHIRDYYMVGNFEALATPEFTGTSIAIGIGGFEWNQNSGANPYQSNIEQITKNAIEYLKTK